MAACGPRHCLRRVPLAALALLVEHDPAAAVLVLVAAVGPAARMAGLGNAVGTAMGARPTEQPRRAVVSPLRRSRAAPLRCPRRLW